MDNSTLKAIAEGLTAGIGLTLTHLYALTRDNPFRKQEKGLIMNAQDFQAARQLGLQYGEKFAAIVGAGLGFVEGCLPNADAKGRRDMLVSFLATHLAALEVKVDEALHVPDGLAASIAAMTTNPATLGAIIDWFEAEALVAVALPAVGNEVAQ